MLPLAKPALAVVALFTFMAAWNDFLGPLVYIQRPEQYTLALGLQAFQSQHGGTEWNLLMAASVLVCLPIILSVLPHAAHLYPGHRHDRNERVGPINDLLYRFTHRASNSLRLETPKWRWSAFT